MFTMTFLTLCVHNLFLMRLLYLHLSMMKLWRVYLHSSMSMMELPYLNFYVDGPVVLLELLYLDVQDLMLYDHVADAPLESLDALDELADVGGPDVGCLCQSLWSRCPTLLLTILDIFLDVLLQNVDVETILLHSHVCLDLMDVLLLRHIPHHDADDDLDVDPNVVLNISDVDSDIDVANVPVDANLEMAGSGVAHLCRFQSYR